MPKALLVSTVSRQFTLFDRDNIKILRELGYEVHCAANYEDATTDLDLLNIVRHHIDIQRSPYSFRNIKAFFQLLKMMKREKYDLVHCHSPMGGVLGRLCANLAGIRPVLYTAHGFHFYKGAPLINNLIYKNVERILAKYTDVLITMNSEDYCASKKFKLRKGGKCIFIPGVGVDTFAINNKSIDRESKRYEIGVDKNSFLILSVGELIKRKNHAQGIRSIAKIIAENKNINLYYVICGKGILLNKLKKLCKDLNVEDRVIFLGYRNDIVEILKASDLFLFTSYQEGLPKSLMEAMAAGLPVIATNIRGNNDLIEDRVNGFLVDCDDIENTCNKILELIMNRELRLKMGAINLERIKKHDILHVNKIMKNIYCECDKLDCPNSNTKY